jgi:hypothetical protein
MGRILSFILYVYMTSIAPLWYKIRYLSIKPIKSKRQELAFEEIEGRLVKLLSNFNYTYDNVKELGDAIVPPDYAYHQLTNLKLYDDCDGFHAGVYQMLQNAGYKSCLFTSLNENVMSNHVMVLFEYQRDIYLVNYNKVIKVTPNTIDNMTREVFNLALTTVATHECNSQSYFKFGLSFTSNRWFKRVYLFDFFKKE